jgi:hypothetical protein
MMYGHEKSDPAIVAVKPTNKSGAPRYGAIRGAGKRLAPGHNWSGIRWPREHPTVGCSGTCCASRSCLCC